MKIVYGGIVKESGVHIYNRKAFDEECKRLMGKKIEITISPKRKTRSLMQNAYYWGVVVPLIKQGLVDVGYQVSIEQAHDLLKAKFRQIEIINEKTGEIIKSVGSTANATTTEMMDYIANIQRWATEYLGVNIPDPNEQVSFDYD